MTFLSADQRELFLPLIDGIHDNPPWGAFMRNLVARTYARRAFLVVVLANAPADQAPTVLHVTAPRAANEPPLDMMRLDSLRLHPHSRMRPERVYSLDEMLDYDRPEQLAHQRAVLEEMGIRYGRWLRISAPGAADAWLVLAREREDFTGSAVSTMSMIAPHLAAALRTFCALAAQRLQTALAEDSLARIGVGQVAFDVAGHVMAADREAERLLTFSAGSSTTVGRKLQLLPETGRQLEAHCAALASSPEGACAALLLDERRDLWMLLRKSDLTLDGPHAAPAVIGTLRIERYENSAAAIRTIAAVHGLSAREAALAHAITLGESIVEAGRCLGLTTETSRNYSKRIYAKTGTSGQADLVRKLLNGLAPFS